MKKIIFLISLATSLSCVTAMAENNQKCDVLRIEGGRSVMTKFNITHTSDGNQIYQSTNLYDLVPKK
jgi:hypothetical protein